MPTTITRITAYDVRFPTSPHLDGSDAMNPDARLLGRLRRARDRQPTGWPATA